MGKNQDRIAELKKELAKYSQNDEARLKIMDERKQIAELKKQIRAKKYAGLKQTGKNLKIIGKNIGIITNNIGKGMGKFIGEDPNLDPSKPRRKTVEEVMRDLPQ